MTLCGACVDTATDPANCGVCGRVRGGPGCAAGTCARRPPTPTADHLALLDGAASWNSRGPLRQPVGGDGLSSTTSTSPAPHGRLPRSCGTTTSGMFREDLCAVVELPGAALREQRVPVSGPAARPDRAEPSSTSTEHRPRFPRVVPGAGTWCSSSNPLAQVDRWDLYLSLAPRAGSSTRLDVGGPEPPRGRGGVLRQPPPRGHDGRSGRAGACPTGPRCSGRSRRPARRLAASPGARPVVLVPERRERGRRRGGAGYVRHCPRPSPWAPAATCAPPPLSRRLVRSTCRTTRHCGACGRACGTGPRLGTARA